MNISITLSLILAGYLIGSIPVAWLLTKAVTGQDIRQLGSGNVGVMNTAISTARWAGLLVFLGEAAKGILAVTISRTIGAGDLATGLTVIAAVIGTRWSFWMGFSGGRGNTAGAAALLLISWQSLVVLLGIWTIARFILHNSFYATRLMLLLLPVVLGFATSSWEFVLTGIVLTAIYLNAQQVETDDHLILKEQWSSFWEFLTSLPRK